MEGALRALLFDAAAAERWRYAAFDGKRVSPKTGRFTQMHGMAEKR